jgi:hypothetical protein
MTDRSLLERRYRRLLACYPRAFRAEYEEQMLIVLLACARDGRRRPGLADSVNLVMNALHVHLRPRTPRAVPAAFWGVRMMALAAALELAAAATVLVSRGALHRAIARHYPRFTSAHVASLVSAHTVSVLIGAPIAAVIWLVLAGANDRGHRWARGGAVAMLVLTSVSLLTAVGDHAATFAVANLTAGTVLWVVSLLATGLILSPPADRHYGRRKTSTDGPRDLRPGWSPTPGGATWN